MIDKALATSKSVGRRGAPARLVHCDDGQPGITRVRDVEGFRYRWPNGRWVTSAKTLARIRSLAIPPAYEDVWICPDENGHLQATGRDSKGRKQYRYHPAFRQSQEATKFGRMLSFSKALPKIHERLDHDLALRGLPKEKVLALVVHLLERSLIRVGNEEYARTNKSYGLTTLLSRHVKIEGSDIRFRFVGKSKIRHDIAFHDRRLARLVSKLQELRGQELFRYVGEDGEPHAVNSGDVNAYLREASGGKFTAKDFRTWAGTLLAVSLFLDSGAPSTKKESKSQVVSVVKTVAAQLRNTPSVCRKCYIHPAVIQAYEEGSLAPRRHEKSLEQVLSRVIRRSRKPAS